MLVAGIRLVLNTSLHPARITGGVRLEADLKDSL